RDIRHRDPWFQSEGRCRPVRDLAVSSRAEAERTCASASWLALLMQLRCQKRTDWPEFASMHQTFPAYISRDLRRGDRSIRGPAFDVKLLRNQHPCRKDKGGHRAGQLGHLVHYTPASSSASRTT